MVPLPICYNFGVGCMDGSTSRLSKLEGHSTTLINYDLRTIVEGCGICFIVGDKNP